MAIQRFPNLPHQKKDDNPAIQLFGRRFYKDQTEIEYLMEFLLVFLSPKYIADVNSQFSSGFPEVEEMQNWPEKTPLKYIPEERIGLKLFSFLASSKLESRHKCHQDRFKQMLAILRGRIETDYDTSEEQVLELLEQLLGGFVGIAANRTWCTQVFLPVSEGLIAGETIWARIKGNKQPNLSWEDAFQQTPRLFEFSKHDFMARGGEVLYLQLCNLMRFFASTELSDFETDNGFEKNGSANSLQIIQNALQDLFAETSSISSLVQWIEDADPETPAMVKKIREPAQCGWCPQESWQEACIFAHELANICRATVDPLEKIDMLTLCCVFQVLRSLCAQSVRHSTIMTDELRSLGGINGFAWILTPARLDEPAFKETAKQNLVRMREVIYDAVKNPAVISPLTTTPKGKDEKKADEQSQNLFIHLGKRIGLIAPRTGSGARFVLPEKLLRYLVLALIPPGKTMTLASFTDRMFLHYGMAVSGSTLKKAIGWSYPRQKIHEELQKKWLEQSLRATGFLIPLSDAVSQVQNPFGHQEIE